MRKLLAVFILVFFAVIAVGSLVAAVISWPPLAFIFLLFSAPFAVVWAIGELEED